MCVCVGLSCQPPVRWWALEDPQAPQGPPQAVQGGGRGLENRKYVVFRSGEEETISKKVKENPRWFPRDSGFQTEGRPGGRSKSVGGLLISDGGPKVIIIIISDAGILGY